MHLPGQRHAEARLYFVTKSNSGPLEYKGCACDPQPALRCVTKSNSGPLEYKGCACDPQQALPCVPYRTN